jgi:hypothetical protein
MSTPSQCDRAFFQALGFAQAVNNCSEEAAFNMQLLLPLSQGLLKMIQLGLIGLAPPNCRSNGVDDANSFSNNATE